MVAGSRHPLLLVVEKFFLALEKPLGPPEVSGLDVDEGSSASLISFSGIWSSTSVEPTLLKKTLSDVATILRLTQVIPRALTTCRESSPDLSTCAASGIVASRLTDVSCWRTLMTCLFLTAIIAAAILELGTMIASGWYFTRGNSVWCRAKCKRAIAYLYRPSINWVCKCQSPKSALENSSVSFRPSVDKLSNPTKAQCWKLVQQNGKTRSSTFRDLSFLRIFQQKRPMKNDTPAN